MPIMAIDYGDAHTGVAISDATLTLSGYTTVINSRRPEEVLAALEQLIADHAVTELVLGYPKNMDGTLGPQAEKCAALAAVLREMTGLEVILWDERRTTVDAHRILSDHGRKTKKHRQNVDAVAATLILEGYLASL